MKKCDLVGKIYCSGHWCPKEAVTHGMCRSHYAQYYGKTRKGTADIFDSDGEKLDLADQIFPINNRAELARVLGVTRQRVEHIIHRKQNAARASLRYAVKTGKIVKPTVCESCGKPDENLHGHHEDYDKPLDAQWLCSRCHNKVHAPARRARMTEEPVK